MSLGDHLEELRTRLIYAIIGLVIAVVICLCFGKYIVAFIEKPFIDELGEDAILQSIAPAEGIISYMKIGLIAGVILASPWIFYQLWQFVGAGLYPHEKRYIYKSIPFSAGLFITGALFFIFVIAPKTLKFFVLFNERFLGVKSNFTFANYISFIGMLSLIFGLAFQTPIAIFVLYKTGMVSIADFYRFRKYVIFGIIVVASAVIPGSEPFSLFALVIPMVLLYELGILLCRFSERKKKSKDATE
ncbi:MAG: twin-arginine translocase subunit TatC [Sedimentisphaerales bacterium]|nr:twin-arginine translocase subunit TatC [Sedimentisphaerales bacterium]